MIAVQSKTAATSAHQHVPFFNKGKGEGFFKSVAGENSFFTKEKKSHPGIQNKLTIGQPNDIYEKEADAVADKVVQRLSVDHAGITGKNGTPLQTKPIATLPVITPLVQSKCATCEQAEKLQKKEDEDEGHHEKKLQKKPIFESNAEPPDDNKNIRRKCVACEKEEKLQKKKEEEDKGMLRHKLQTKPIFESNVEDGNKNVQKKCAACDHEEKLQKKSGSSSPDASHYIESNLSASKGSGSSLPAETRSQMESSIGSDFSGVKIHTDSRAVQMSKDLGAQAFTHGSDIYFNSGKYDSQSSSGKHLLAHELTHVVQQKPAKEIRRQPGASPAPAAGVSPPSPGSPPPTSGGVNSQGSKARLIADENKGPSIGMPPISSYDYVFKLWSNKELIKQIGDKRSWDFIDKEVTFFKFPTEIGVVLNLNGSMKLGASFEVSIGPVSLRDVRVGLSSKEFWEIAAPLGLSLYPLPNPFAIYQALKKMNGRYFGDATLDFEAMIKGGFQFSAELNADAKFLNLLKIAGLKAGVNASANAQVTALAHANVNLEFKNGEINFNKFFNFESDFLLQLLLNAYLKAEILGWDFDLVNITFQKDYSKNLLSLTAGTPAKINSENGNPKAVIDVPQTIESIKKFIEIFKGNQTNMIEGERKGEVSTLGQIRPPSSIIPAPGNLSSFDSTLSIYLTNERAGLKYGQFEDFMGSNAAVFKYVVLAPGSIDAKNPLEEGFEAAPNSKGELHSEALIIGKLQRLQRSYKGGQHVFKVTHVLSERRPCSNCQSYLDQPNRLIQTKNTSVFWLVPYISGAGKDKTAYWENIRSLIGLYGLTPPSIEAIKEKLEPKTTKKTPGNE